MNECTIQKILSVQPIENSDNIEQVKVLGWNVVVKKGEFKEGDLCVYVSLDTQLPEKSEFEFLRKDHFRIRTKKIRNCISQGLVLPLSILPDNHYPFKISDDVSVLLEATHYEKPIPVNLRGLVRGNFPSGVPKTDEIRIQQVPEILDEIKGKTVYSTVKCDGSSISIVYKDGDVHICSRNLSLKIEENKDNIYIKTAEKYDLINKLKKHGKNIAIQGELCGPGIQKNRMGLKEHKIFVFDVWDIDKQQYYSYYNLVLFCSNFHLDMVPIVDVFTIKNETIDDLLKMSEGLYDGTSSQREGIVIRGLCSDYSNTLKNRISFKVLNNKYLLKYE